MVSVGNPDAVVDIPAMENIIGGQFMFELGGNLESSLHLPISFIPNSINQAGYTYLTTEER